MGPISFFYAFVLPRLHPLNCHVQVRRCLLHYIDISYSVTNSAGATQSFSSNHKMSSEQKNLSSFNSQSDLILICDWLEMNELRFFRFELVL